MEPEKHPTQQENKCYPNMPAFASEHSFGLTKREYFASIILSGLVAEKKGSYLESFDDFTQAAIKFADVLIKNLNQ